MTVLATVALAALLLEDDYLLALYEGLENLANHLGSIDGRSTNLNCVVGFGEEYTVKLDCVTFFVLVTEIVNIQELLRLCLELLSLDFYDSVHLNYCVTGYTFGRRILDLHLIEPGEAKSTAKLKLYSLISKYFCNIFISAKKKSPRERAHEKWLTRNGSRKERKGKINLTGKSHAEAQRAQRIFIIKRL